MNRAAAIGKLKKCACITKTLRIHGFDEQPNPPGDLNGYGTDGTELRGLIAGTPELGERLHEALPVCAAQVLWAARREMARTVDDVLSRRTRALLLDAKAAIAMAPKVAKLLAGEFGRDERWQSAQVTQFTALARNYLVR